MKRDIVLAGQAVSYTLRVSARARRLRMTVSMDRELVVTIPNMWHERFVEGFLRQKAAWITKHLARIKKIDGKVRLAHSRDEYEKNKLLALQVITKRVDFFNALYRFPYKKISIRNQTSLWGSCTRTGNLQFNYKLMHLPQRTIDYVVVHELCHLKEHNHGLRFWGLVARTMPDYKEIRRSLHQYIMQ